MSCASCGRTNPAIARFCAGCGTPLAARCPACGTENEGDARFCIGCGASLAARLAAVVEKAEARKVVTIVFADLIGSTSLHERLDPESVSRVMERYHSAVRAPVEAHGGTIVALLGDGVMCAFGVPHVAEDDAIRAVRASVGIQQAFREFAREHAEVLGDAGLRVAVNTGEVVVSDEYAAGIGDPLNVAARLQQEAHDGDVLIGESTQRLVSELVTLAPFGVLALKGRSETVNAYRVVSLDRPAGASATPFVGRDAELRRLMAVYDAAVATPAARLAVILGSPGLGKSRLLDELTRRFTGAIVLTASCEAAGGATFAPIARALRTHLRIDDGTAGDELRAAIEVAVPGDGPSAGTSAGGLRSAGGSEPQADADRGRIAAGIAALLAGEPASPEETFFIIRRLLGRLAATQPVVLAIDDLHWAEPLLLDLLEHLVQWSTDVPLLVLAAARPELREARSSLATPGGLVAEVVTLAGLDAGAATRLAANVIGADELPAAVAGRVLATSEGNPLFVGELVRMLVHDGALKREGDRWTTGVEVAALEMPPTIQALLAARIERLRPEERIVLERASIVGRQFSRAAVTHLLPREVADLDTRLEALRRSELIEPDTGWFLGEPVLRFHHVLIRDAAYRRVLKGTRAELHGRVADWIESRVGQSIEHDEIIGWHLEQAHQHLSQLGPIDAPARALGERAARYLGAAGKRALARDDLAVAANLLGRGLHLLDEADPRRADLTLDWCEALLAAGDVGPAATAIEELARLPSEPTSNQRPETRDRLQAWHTCFAGELAALTDPQTLRATAAAVAAAAEALASVGDDAGEAKAHSVHATALARLGKVGACEAALDRALAAARRGNDRRRSNTVLAGAPLAALWGPSPVTRASGRCLDVVRVLRITQGAPAVEAVALRCQGVLEALRGRTEAARRMIDSSRRMVEELGITHRLLEADVFAGLIEMYEGNAAAAERCLRPAYDGLRSHGLGIDAAQAAALLGRALLLQDRAAEAEALSHESEALAGDDLQAAIAWRGVRAEALARRGEHAAAVDFARDAVDLAAATDALLYHADARLALAAALRAAGRSDEAAAEEARAIELWEAKGATLLAERARREAGRVEPAALAPVPPTAAPATNRRVQTNAATANLARLDAAIAARDAGALHALFAEEMQTTTHFLAGGVYDRQGVLATWRALLSAEAPACRHELLATVGDALVLCRQFLSASGFRGRTFDVGPYERDAFALIEVDSNGRQRRSEFFAPDKLGDVIVGLYERYAELLADGPERARAAATAGAVAALQGSLDVDRWEAAISPTVEFIDHRTLGLPPAHGAEAFVLGLRSLLDLTDHTSTRVDDVLALRSNAVLFLQMNFGTTRAAGGAYERPRLALGAFGPDGLLARLEYFDVERVDEALARFEKLVSSIIGTREGAPPTRRVRANAATAHVARMDAAMADRDAGALPGLFADELEVLDHPTGSTVDRQGTLTSLGSMLRVPDLSYRHEHLATLGDSLGLFRMSISASGVSGERFDVGAYDIEKISVGEVDAQGRGRRVEDFAPDKLGDAIVRLYERYAELLPDGPERARVAATARTVAALQGPPPERFPLAPDVEATDHRTVGFGSLRGTDAVVRAIRSLLQLSDDFATHLDDALALRSDALLVRWTTSGTIRASGGDFERHSLMLWVFGDDGLVTRWEQFDVDQDADALARFDELTAVPRPIRRRVRPNAATAIASRMVAAFDARDAGALAALYADGLEVIHHPTGKSWEREGTLASSRAFFAAQAGKFRHEPLGTLGDSLALCRESISGSGFAGAKFDVGAYEKEELSLIEADARGKFHRGEYFAVDRLDDALVRLYQRHADLLPEGRERTRAAATACSVAAVLQPGDVDRRASAFAPAIEATDHRTVGFGSLRGSAVVVQAMRALRDLTQESTWRCDDVLGVRADALLVRMTQRGTDRAGGEFERRVCHLCCFGDDGLETRLEQFDAEQEAEALARFDALAAAAPRPVRRWVRANAATAQVAQLDAAIAARDADALPTFLAEDYEAIDHMTGATYGRSGQLRSYRRHLRTQDLGWSSEPLATLGDSLALCRLSVSGSGAAGPTFDVGAFEVDRVTFIEVDAQARRRRTEVFASDHLSDAVARLYERYGELLPDGPERERAAATARSVAAVVGPFDPDRLETAFARDVESTDHRILGTWSARGAEALLQHYSSVLEIADDVAIRDDEILALRPDALLLRRTHLGTARAGGGAYEREYLALSGFGADGLLVLNELFDCDREDEALARFDEVTAEPAPVRFAAALSLGAEKRKRRVRANAATANAARLEAATAARDIDAIDDVFSESTETVNHPTGATYDRDGILTTMRGALASSRDFARREEPLASLGDSLALLRASLSAAGFTGGRFDVGAFERESINLIEVDARGRRRRSEVFASDHLGDAVARLYERYAELLPDGPERERAAATARSVATVRGAFDPDRYAAVFAPAIEAVDHRATIGWGAVRGVEAFRELLRTQLEVAVDIATRVDDIVALRPDALLVHWTNFGTVRAGGGAYERLFLMLWVFGPDGLVTHIELFDSDRADEAVWRFDELTAEPLVRGTIRRRVRPNAATANAARTDTAIAARDAGALADVLSDPCWWIDHTTGTEYGRPGVLSTWRSLLRAQNPTHRHGALATLGDSLALCRYSTSASGYAGRQLDVGAYEREEILLIEVDSEGRRRWNESFATDHLGDSVTRLYERYADLLPDGPARERAAATARSVAARMLAPYDPDRYAAACTPAIEVVDHRTLGTWSARGAEALLRNLRSWLALADGIVNRCDDILGLRSDALLARWMHLGTDRASGGAYERPFVMLQVFGGDGLMTRWELFDSDRDTEALARFDELIPSPSTGLVTSPAESPVPNAPPARIENAVTRLGERFMAAWAQRDWQGIAALFAPDFRLIDRRRYAHIELDRDQHLESLRFRFEMSSSRTALEIIATRGRRLALVRQRFELAGGDVGPSETESLNVAESGEDGNFIGLVTFDPEELDAAYAELDARYTGGEAAAHGRVAAGMSAFARAIATRDWDAMSALLSPDLVVNDHRPLGWETLHGPAMYVESLRSLVDLAPDVRLRWDHMRLSDRAALFVNTWRGTREGGAFEAPRAVVSEFDAGGRVRSMDFYDPEQLGEAQAQFEALRGSTFRCT